MAKDQMLFDATPNYYELEGDETEVLARRIQTYSNRALKAGLPVDTILVNHTRFKQSLDSINRIFQIAREVNLPHGMSVIGPPGSGKSTLIKYFCDSLPKSSLFTSGFGGISLRIGMRPTAGEILSAILRHYKYPFPTVTPITIPIRKYHAFDLIRLKGTRVVFVDGAHHLLSQVKRRNNVSGETVATSLLSEMMDETKVGLVLCGQGGVDELLDSEPDLADRVTGRLEFAGFEPDKQWVALLGAFVKHCEWFDISIVNDPIQARLLHTVTAGNLRGLKRILTEAVLIAAEEKAKGVEVQHLKTAFTAIYGVHGKRTNPYG